jgi:hypothetical protein
MEFAATGSPQLFGLLASRRFWPLFGMQFLNAFNDQLFKTAFLVLLTWRLAAERGLEHRLDLLNLFAGLLFILPFGLVAPTAGQVADGMDKARLMRLLALMDVAVMGLALLAFPLGSVTFLFVLLALTGIQSALFAPVKYAVLPRYLAREELVTGNGLVAAGTFLAIILGQIAGAKLVLAEGGATLTAVGMLAVSATAWGFTLFALPVPPRGPRPRPDWLLPRATIRVIGRVARAPEPFFAILCFSWFWFIGAGVTSFVPALARDTLHGTEDVALVLLLTFSLGVAAGALGCARLLAGRISYRIVPPAALGILAGIAIAGLGLAAFGGGIDPGAPLLTGWAFATRSDAWPVLAGFFIMSVSAGFYAVPLSTIYQVTSPEAERGRFVAAANVMDAILIVAAALLSMLLIALGLDRVGVLLVLGLTALPVAILVLRHHRSGPDLRSPG